MCFTGTDVNNNVITYTPAGGSPISTPQCFAMSGGALTGGGASVANANTASPQPLFYRIQLVNGSTVYLTLLQVQIFGSSYSMNSYAVPASGYAVGAGTPKIACSAGARYTSTTSASGSNYFTCSSGGTWQTYPTGPFCGTNQGQLASQASGTQLCIAAETEGSGAPKGICTEKQKYFQTDASAGSYLWGCFNGSWTQSTAGATGPTGATGPPGEVTNATLESAFNPGTVIGTTTIGTSWIPVNNTVTANVAVVMPFPSTVDGNITLLKTTFAPVPANSTIDILIYSGTPTSGQPSVFTIVKRVTVNVPSSTIISRVSFQDIIDFNNLTIQTGQYIGYIGNNGALPMDEGSSGGAGLWYFIGDPGTGPQTYSVISSNTIVDLEATIVETVGQGMLYGPLQTALIPYATETYVNNAIAAIPFNSNKPKTTLWDEPFSGTSLPANWSTSSGWSVSSGLISPTSGQGYSNQALFSRYFNIEDRTVRITFQILASGTIMGFGSIMSANANNGLESSLFSVDSSTNTINIYNSGFTNANPGILASSPLGFTMTTGQNYVMQITLNGREITATLADPITGTIAIVSYGNNATDVGQLPWGQLADYPTFVAIAGQFKILDFTTLANYTSPDVMILGDSITYGFLVEQPQRWGSLIGSQIPNDSYVVSARPGGSSFGVLGKMTSEVAYLSPKILIILIGTNDSTGLMSLAQFETNMTAILSQASTIGAKVVIGLIPIYGPNPSAPVPFNNYLKTLTNVTLVHFELATSLNNDGVTQNTALFESDTVHPNPAGYIAMANRFSVDAPFIFD